MAVVYIHPEMKMHPLIIHPNGVPNMHEHKTSKNILATLCDMIKWIMTEDRPQKDFEYFWLHLT